MGHGIAFAPMHGREGSPSIGDLYIDAARAWCGKMCYPMPYLYDNRKPRWERISFIKKELTRNHVPFEAIGFFGFAGATGLQCGYALEDIEDLAVLIVGQTLPAPAIVIEANDPVVITCGVSEVGAFADLLYKRMRKSGKWNGSVDCFVSGGPNVLYFGDERFVDEQNQ